MKVRLTIFMLFIANTFLFAQKHDSLFFLVDKRADYIHFNQNSKTKDFCIKIKCDYETSCDEDYVSFGFCFYENRIQLGGNKLNISKKKLKQEFSIINTEWIHQQKKEQDLWKKIPIDWCFDKINFVIFREDFLSCKKEVTAYNVSCLEGYTEFQIIMDP